MKQKVAGWERKTSCRWDWCPSGDWCWFLPLQWVLQWAAGLSQHVCRWVQTEYSLFSRQGKKNVSVVFLGALSVQMTPAVIQAGCFSALRAESQHLLICGVKQKIGKAPFQVVSVGSGQVHGTHCCSHFPGSSFVLVGSI